MSDKLLTVNADDFGYTHDVNSGIVEAHHKGILTATTLMANAPAFDDAVRLSRANPTLDVGCHLVLVGGTSMLTGEPYPRDVPGLIKAIIMRQIKPYPELRDQIRKMPGKQPDGMYANFVRLKAELRVLDAELKRRAGTLVPTSSL